MLRHGRRAKAELIRNVLDWVPKRCIRDDLPLAYRKGARITNLPPIGAQQDEALTVALFGVDEGSLAVYKCFPNLDGAVWAFRTQISVSDVVVAKELGKECTSSRHLRCARVQKSSVVIEYAIGLVRLELPAETVGRSKVLSNAGQQSQAARRDR